MIKSFFFILGLSIIVLFMFSCSSAYIPTMSNIPLHDNKGEAQLSAGVGMTSIHASGDYAITDKLALQFNGNVSFHNFSNSFDIFTNDKSDRRHDGFLTLRPEFGEFSHRYGEFGIGRYNLLKSEWKLETFIGSGYGAAIEKAEDNFSETPENIIMEDDINCYYFLGFIQANIGRKKGRSNFEYGLGFRIDYTNINFDYKDMSVNTNISFDNIGIEPVAFVRFGTAKLRFYNKIGFTYLYCLDSLDEVYIDRGIRGEFNYTELHLSVGINYKFGGRSK